MSADAKLWQTDDGDWHAIHDGDCQRPDGHHGTVYDLVELIEQVNACMDPYPIKQWSFRVYPFDRMSQTPMYMPRLHMLSNNGTWCDQCGPKSFYSEQEWNRMHGFRIA